MARILLTTWGSLGDLYPSLRIAERLTAQGHDAALATCGVYGDIVRSRGVQFHAVRPDLRPDDGALVRRMMDPRRGAEVIVEELLAPAVRTAFDDLLPLAQQAEVIVSHPMTFAAPLAAEFLGKRWLSTVLAPASFFSVHDFPVPPQAPALANTLVLGRVAGWALRSIARAGSTPWMGPVRALRADLGLPDRGHPLFEGQFSPHGTLAMFSPVLADPQPDWPPHTTVTGFVFDPHEEPLPDDVSAFIDAGDPPVVFTLGSSAAGAPGDFHERAFDAIREIGCRAVVLAGKHRTLAAAHADWKDVLIVDAAPHAALFARAAAVVHHGGVGTLAEALRAGVPMVIVPFAHDQPDNAKRAAHLGVARVAARSRLAEGELILELDALLSNATYADQARLVAQRVGGEDGLAVACDLLASL